MIDMVRFRTINDTLGHEAGDEMLRVVGQRLAQGRKATDIIARVCGDEFALVVPDVVSENAARPMIARLLETLRQSHAIGRREISPDFSFGVAFFPAHGSKSHELMKHAGIALNRTKSIGRRGVTYYQDALKSRIERHQHMADALRDALRRDGITIALQPQVRIDTGEVSGFEALARWRWRGRDVPPDEFIATAEVTGQIGALGHSVLDQALAAHAALQRWQETPASMAVNAASAELRQPDYAETVRRLLARHGVPARALEIEITENVLLERSATQIVRTLDALHALGVHIALDDFGTGYASLAHLRHFPIDRLKIDRSFVSGIPDTGEDAIIVRTMIDLAHDLGMDVVAEGIETQTHLTWLTAHGCDIGQGYFLGRPEDVEDAIARLADQNRKRQKAG